MIGMVLASRSHELRFHSEVIILLDLRIHERHNMDEKNSLQANPKYRDKSWSKDICMIIWLGYVLLLYSQSLSIFAIWDLESII